MDDDLDPKLKVTYYTLAPPVVLLMFSTNILILVLIFRNNKLRNRANVFVASWAVCDIILGLVLLAQVIFMGIRNLTTTISKQEMIQISANSNIDHLNISGGTSSGNLYLCVFWASLQLLPVLVSCLHWVGLACERFIAIMDAVHYEERLTCRRLKYCVISLWTYGLFVSALPFVWHNKITSIYGGQFCNLVVVLSRFYILMLVLVHFLPCLLVTAAVFTRMFIHVRAHQRQVHVTHTMTQDKLLEDFTVARSFLMAFVASVVFWSPFFICSLVGVVKGFSAEIQTCVSACMLVGVLASTWKLFIYILSSKDYMKAFKDIVIKRPPQLRHRAHVLSGWDLYFQTMSFLIPTPHLKKRHLLGLQVNGKSRSECFWRFQLWMSCGFIISSYCISFKTMQSVLLMYSSIIAFKS